MVEPPPPDRCNFCGLRRSQVDHLFAGPGVAICERCVALCVDEGALSRQADRPNGSALTLDDGREFVLAHALDDAVRRIERSGEYVVLDLADGRRLAARPSAIHHLLDREAS